VAARESRDRVEGERASKPNGEREGSTGHQREVPEVRSDPVRARGQSSTRQSSWGDSHGAEEKNVTRTELLNYHSLTNRRAAYLVGTSRSVGRGWPLWPLPTRFEIISHATQEIWFGRYIPVKKGCDWQLPFSIRIISRPVNCLKGRKNNGRT
jgi:hypothetical protein